jgi:predicted site-specific integrase-resolvase
MQDKTLSEDLPLVGSKEVLKLLGVSHKTLISWIDKGWIVGTQRVGKAFVFRKDFKIKKEAVRMNIDEISQRLTD